jgi:hypothetical protein
MDNQIRMRVSDGSEHIDKEVDTRFDVERATIAITIDVFAANMFENEIWLHAPANTRVQKLCDMWMSEPTEDCAFASEALLSAASREGNVEKLYRRPTLEPPIAALGKPNAAHPALTDWLYQLVCADRLASHCRINRQR